MSKIDDGGPAYPTTIRVRETNPETRTGHTCMVTTVKEIPMPGMSLRDWFAGMALNGFQRPSADGSEYANSARIAEAAYDIADAMLSARKEDA